MKNRIKIIIIALFSLIITNVVAQETDKQTWLTLELTLPLHEKVEFAFENEMRFIHNTTMFGRNQAEFELCYLLNKQWSFGLGYRAKTTYPMSDYSFVEHRWLADIMWKTRVKRFRINTRLRVLNDQESFVGEPMEELMHREKIRFSYKIRKSPFLVYTAVETYFPLHSQQLFELRKLRMVAGTRIQIAKQTRATFDIIYDREFNRNINEKVLAIQIGFTYNLGKSEE